MNTSTRLILTALTGSILACSSHAVIVYAGPAGFSVNPYSDGALTGPGLIVGSTLPGIDVSGQVSVTVSPTGGFLLQWEALRPINTTLSGGFQTTTTSYIGFIIAPSGHTMSSGMLHTDIYHASGPSGPAGSIFGSDSNIPFSFTGPGTTNFNLSATSGTFVYLPNPSDIDYLRQTYTVDYAYFNALPGTYILDFPAGSTITDVPEPTAITSLLLGAACLAWRRRRN